MVQYQDGDVVIFAPKYKGIPTKFEPFKASKANQMTRSLDGKTIVVTAVLHKSGSKEAGKFKPDSNIDQIFTDVFGFPKF